MKHYRLAKEADQHFELHDTRDKKSFKVAKKGLNEKDMERIRKLGMVGMQSGGFVGPPALPTPEPEEVEAADTPAPSATPGIFDPGGTYNPDAWKAINPFGARPLTGPPAPGIEAGPIYDKGRPAGEALTDLQKTNQPEIPKTNLHTTPEIYGAPSMQKASYQPPANPQQATADLATENDAIIGKQVKAYETAAAQAAAGAAEQKKIADQYVQQSQALQADTQKRYAAIDQEQEQLKADIAATKVDPTRLWSNMSTGNKVLAGISVLLSGFGSGLAGGPNLALQVINKSIDQDIEAQKSELGKKQNLLSENYRKYGDLRAATAATALQLNSVAQAQIGAQAAKVGGAQAQANAQSAITQLQLQANQYKAQLAQSQTVQAAKDAIMNGGAQGPGMPLSTVDSLFPGRGVVTPNGAFPAGSPEEAKKLRDAEAVAKKIDTQLKDMLTFNKTTGSTVPYSASDDAAERMRTNLTLAYKNLFELGVLSENDTKLLDKIVPNIGGVRTDKTTAQIVQARKILNDGMQAAYSSHLLGYQGQGGAKRETPAGGEGVIMTTSGKR